MAGRGPAQKQTPLSRPNDEARKRASFTQITADGVVRGPDLPDGPQWHPRTLVWWQTWRVSAMAQRFTATDWDFLLDTAVLHSEFWDGKSELAPELRLRVAKFGATIEDRMRLRVETTGAEGKPGERTHAPRKTSARRSRLLKAVGDD